MFCDPNVFSPNQDVAPALAEFQFLNLVGCGSGRICYSQAKVIDRENNKMDQWIKEAIHLGKEHDKSMNRDEISCQLSHIYDRLFTATSGGEWKLSSLFLDSFRIWCQRRILHIRWHDFVSNDEVLHRTGLFDVSYIIRKRRLGLRHQTST